MKRLTVLFLLFVFCLSFAVVYAGDAQDKPERKYVLERVKCGPKDFAVVQVYADNFEELSLPDKLQVYYLTKAAEAGSDIWFDQNHRNALEIKRVLEEIITHPEGINKDVLEKIFNYAKIFWAEGGNYGERDKLKFIPEFTYDELLAAAKTAQKNGADFGVTGKKSLEEQLNALNRVIFDINYEPLSVCKDSSKDIVGESAVNFYSKDIAAKDLENFKENNQLNALVLKENGVLVEKVYKIGGVYSDYLKGINQNLGNAKSVIPPDNITGQDQIKTIEKLAEFFTSGNIKDFEEYNIQWVKTKGMVDCILGFIESYKDPRGVKATFEGCVFYTDFENTRLMNLIGENVKYFEERMPWEDKYKRTNFGTAPVANSVMVAMGTGDAGTQAPVGINLPNDEQIRQSYGTKSVSLYNIMESIRKVSGDKVKKEFYMPEVFDLVKEYGDKSVDMEIALHEVCGHASGKTTVKDPDNCLKEYARAWEEGRAELVALWHLTDPLFYENKICSKEDLEKIGKAGYTGYVTGDFVNLRRIPGPVIQDDHMRAAHFITTYLIEEAKVVKPVEIDGKIYMTVPDTAKMREAVGRLLSIVMEVKANGDYEKAKEMMNRYGVKVNTDWQKQVNERYVKLDLPMYRALVYPQYGLVEDDSGEVIDVAVEYNEGLTAQQLRLSGYSEEEIYNALEAEKTLR
ncbi:MAG: hypothetical protein ABIH00_03085 [Armatimonadota bacterium]